MAVDNEMHCAGHFFRMVQFSVSERFELLSSASAKSRGGGGFLCGVYPVRVIEDADLAPHRLNCEQRVFVDPGVLLYVTR